MTQSATVRGDGGEQMTTPVWARCGRCRHVWIKHFVPMELGLVVKLLRGLCPKCGAPPKHQFVYEPGRIPPEVRA